MVYRVDRSAKVKPARIRDEAVDGDKIELDLAAAILRNVNIVDAQEAWCFVVNFDRDITGRIH